MKKKIAILIPQLTGGGAERVASNLSLMLPNEKYDKFIIMYNNKIDFPYEGKIINLGIKSSRTLVGKLIKSIYRIYKVKKIKKKLSISTTISFLSSPNLINILSKKKDKTIISVRNYLSASTQGFYGILFRLLIKLFYNKADTIIAVSHVIKNDLIKNFGIKDEKIKVIYNPYDTYSINELANEDIEDKYIDIFKNPVIITAGRLYHQKGHWHLIKAFKKVKEEIPNIKLVILGKGDLENYLKRLSNELKLNNDVHFLGFQKNPFKFIKNSVLYVFPSLYEGFPNALCEAMACGVPVLSSDCNSGPREILEPNSDVTKKTNNIEYSEYGVLTPVCDGKKNINGKLTDEENHMSKGIINLLKDKELRKLYSEKSIKRVKDFNIDKIISLWEKNI